MEQDKTAYYVEDEGLALFGENVARTLDVHGSCGGARASRDIRADLHALKSRRDALEKNCSGGQLPPAAEWLLDNFYLAQREGLRAGAALRGAGRFPASGGQSALGALCAALLRAGDGAPAPGLGADASPRPRGRTGTAGSEPAAVATTAGDSSICAGADSQADSIAAATATSAAPLRKATPRSADRAA